MDKGWVNDATEPSGSPLTSKDAKPAAPYVPVVGVDDGSPLSSPVVDDQTTLPNGQRVPKGSEKFVTSPFADGPGF